MDKKLFRSIALLLLTAAVFALAVIKFDWILSGIRLLFSVMTPIIAGVLIAVFLDRPFVLFRKLFLKLFKKGNHRFKLSSALSVTVTYLLLIAFLAVFLVSVIPEVTASVTNLVANVDSYVSNVENALNEVIEKYEILKENVEPMDFSGWGRWITQKIQNIQNRLPEIVDITKSIAGGLANTVLSIIISIYIMLGRNHLKWKAKKVIYAFFPQQAADRIRDIAKRTARTMTGYISGRVIDSIIVGILCFIFMKIFGFEYASLISFIIGVTNIIPMLGPFIGAIPSAFLLLLVNPAQCFWFIIFVIILQQVDSNLIDPRISGEATGLPALWVLVSITVGGGLFGIMGFILSVPLCAVLYNLTREAADKLNQQKGTNLGEEPDRDPPSKTLSISAVKEWLKKIKNHKKKEKS